MVNSPLHRARTFVLPLSNQKIYQDAQWWPKSIKICFCATAAARPLCVPWTTKNCCNGMQQVVQRRQEWRQNHCHGGPRVVVVAKWRYNGRHSDQRTPWWRHQMETFSALLAICAGNSPVPGEFPTQRPVTRSFHVYFDLHPDKRLSKQLWDWWFETLSCSLWRHRNDGPQHQTTIRRLSQMRALQAGGRELDRNLWQFLELWISPHFNMLLNIKCNIF